MARSEKINGALYRSMVIEGALAIAEKEGTGKRTERIPGTGRRYWHEYVHDDGFRNGWRWKSSAEPTLAKSGGCDRFQRCCASARQLGCYPVAAVPRHGEKLRETDEADGRTLALALRESVDTATRRL